MNNLFNKVKESIENAIDNGFDPLAMKARDLAEDIVEKAGNFAEDTVEDVTNAVARVKEHFDKDTDND